MTIDPASAPLDEQSTTPLSDVDRVAAEFLLELGRGRAPDADAFATRLATDDERRQFRELIATVESVRDGFPNRLAPGAVLGSRYRIVDELGSGGMGRVLLARDTRLERDVAVKVLHGLGASSMDAVDPRRRFQKESRLLASLKHPGIVSIHEAGRDGELDYIVMDRIDGVSLADSVAHLRDSSGDSASRTARLRGIIGRAVPDGETDLLDDGDWHRTATRIVVEVARAIEAAHGSGVVHRDLKPGNVMLAGGGRPVVLDFGLGGFVGTEASLVTRGFFGSIAYLAPEQVKRKTVGAEFRTDVYQLGLLLYELVTLERAFPQDTIATTLDSIARGDYPAPRRVDTTIDPALESICAVALATEPEARYPTATALREDLERWLHGERPHAHVDRRPQLAMAIVAVAAAVAAGCALVALAIWLLVETGWIPSDRTSVRHVVSRGTPLSREDQRSPFIAVRWLRQRPEVRVDNDGWYELVSIDGHSARRIVDFCIERYGPLWNKRFEEDLVTVMYRLSGEIPGAGVRLELRSTETGRFVTLEDVPMTHEKRRRLWRAGTGIER